MDLNGQDEVCRYDNPMTWTRGSASGPSLASKALVKKSRATCSVAGLEGYKHPERGAPLGHEPWALLSYGWPQYEAAHVHYVKRNMFHSELSLFMPHDVP